MCTPVANFCSWIKPDASKRAADAQAANARALAEAHAAKVKATAEALAAKAKRDAAAKEVAAAKANYEAILAKVHEGKEKDEWARYWADLERYYRDIGHQAEAKAVSENRVGAFNLNNFWGYPKP
ncbi:hypothetical protein CspeluHIS016_0207340 [Cutaneotrichosporon spelunceum]|uniref:Uncharacterized protein n=1 Tax=Cutaneotrichosporon spelunceum TaxID=1672016 RepID=A0AAD3TRL6_9TREE|nr:hypothetical protein CspeluHIS016_0207340 [Cutaneotrichosporon spelunceum]